MHQSEHVFSRRSHTEDRILKRFVLVLAIFFVSLITLSLLKSYKEKTVYLANSGTTFIIRDSTNSLDTVKRFFESVDAHQMKNIKFVVVGSKTTAETEKIARNKMPEIQLRFSETVNDALGATDSGFVAMLSMTDQFVNSYFIRMSRYLAKAHDISLLCPYEYIRKPGCDRLFMRKDHFLSGILFDNPFTSGCMFSKQFQKDNNIRYRSEYGEYADYDFWSQFLVKDGKIAFNPVPLVIVDKIGQGAHFYYEIAQTQRDLVSKTIANAFHVSLNGTKCDLLAKAKERSDLAFLLSDLKDYIKAYCHQKHRETPRTVIHLAMATDDNYIIPTITAITSALENASAKTFYSIFILHSNKLHDEKKGQMKYLESKYDNCNVTFINMSDEMKAAPTDKRIPVSAYYRLLLPNILPSIEKVIWLDGDVIVLEDLGKMYALPMDGLYLRGQLDNSPSLADQFGVKNDHYICSGVLLMNLEEMRKDNIVHFYLSFIEQFKDKLVQHDQTVINVIGYTKTGILPARYGIFNIYKWTKRMNKFINSLRSSEKYKASEYRAAQQHPAIIHYVRKPWQHKCYFASFWWEYLKHTEFYENACTTLPHTECAGETFFKSNSTSKFVRRRKRRRYGKWEY